MRWLTISVLVACLSTTLTAHHPDKQHMRVHPRIDVIGPLGSALPMSHRRRYNRPKKITGKIVYYIAPSSQEAMAWHSATHRGLYENHRPRIEQHFFYPKPWEGLRIGPRESTTFDAEISMEDETELLLQESDEDLIVMPPGESIANEVELIEQ